MKRIAQVLTAFIFFTVFAAFWIIVLGIITGCGGALEPKESEPVATPAAIEEARELNERRAGWIDETFVEHGHVCEFREQYPSHGYWRARMDRAVFVRVCDTELDGFICAKQWCETL